MAAAGGRIRYGSLEGKSMSSFDAIVCIHCAQERKQDRKRRERKRREKEKKKKEDKLMTLCGN